MKEQYTNDIVQEAMQMYTSGIPRQQVLDHLVSQAEALQGNVVSSILVLDKEGLLRNGSSPGLPVDYLQAIDWLRPHPNVGTCAAAAATGSMVITADFLEDGKWAELKHLPMALGFVGAWSMPIKKDGRVLGTFGTYYRDRRQPCPTDIARLTTLADAAAWVIQQQQ